MHYISLVKYENSCHTAFNNRSCRPNECQCSEDGKTFFLRHKGFNSAGIFSVECKTEFNFAIEMSDCIMIKVIGMYHNSI